MHKSGSYDSPDNYRGIALTSVLSKVFVHILNERLRGWMEEEGIYREEQAGFRRGYSTTDNIFVLHGIIQKYLNRKRKFFACFIDFKKAFDSVNRPVLWQVLRQLGVQGRLLRILQAMYGSVQYCVRSAQGQSQFFESLVGLKQGCKISPLLFTVMINSLIEEVSAKAKHGVQLMPNTPDVSILLFADDVVVFSDTAIGLQNQLNLIKESSDKLGLTVNVSKTKVIVFRSGGYLASHEKWHIGDDEVGVTNEYRYLGIKFTPKLCTRVALSDLASRAKSALSVLNRILKKVPHVPPNVYFKLFDAQVQQILLYGAEVWGIGDCGGIESVHLQAIKNFLNVSFRTPNLMCYGDTGCFPMYINATLRSIKYWLKILRMDSDRLPLRVYRMMCSQPPHVKTWVTLIKDVLTKFGYDNLWSSQHVQNEKEFLKNLRSKMIESFWLQWKSELCGSIRYSFYREIKDECRVENYLYDIDKKVFRDVFVRFRLGCTELYVHKQRYATHPVEMLCPLCREEDEDENHLLLKCPALQDLREHYLCPYVPTTNENHVKILMSNNQKIVNRSTSIFLYKAFQRRSCAINSPECNAFYLDM